MLPFSLVGIRHARVLLQLVGLTVLAAALGAGLASPAVAATKQVEVQDNVFIPPGIAVKPGDSVTWNYPGGGDHHNVSFDDGSFTKPPAPSFGPWMETRTFPTEGVFPYHCQEHGGFGGQGMAGVVYVNATGTIPSIAPLASFTVSPGTARLGQTVTFNSSGSSDPDGSIVRHEWDLDGNGSYETDTGPQATTSQIYATTGPRTVRLRVTDNAGLINETTRSLVVTSEPTASFTLSPSPAQTGQTVSFNGAASSDPDGTIARYEWDLDGDGSFETDTAATPTTSRSYATPGSLSVKLRVTDNAGVTADTARSLQIAAPAQPPAPLPGAPTQPSTPAPAGCSSLSGARRTACMQRSCTALKGATRIRCIQRSCRFVTGTSRARCIQKSCRSLRGTKRTACMLKSCRALKGSKKRACVRKYARRK